MKKIIVVILFLISACAKPQYKKNNNQSDPNEKIALTASAIQFENQNLSASLVWTSAPENRKKTELLLQFFKIESEQKIQSDVIGDLKVFLWMPDMNHGSVPVEIAPLSGGLYHIKNVFFIMPGFWQIHFQILQDQKIVDEAIYDISI